MKIDVSMELLRQLYQAKGYGFDKGINMFGIRNKDTIVDKFNDVLGLAVGDRIIAVSGTTDPGASPLSKTEGVNKNGVFILQPGYYRNCWHKGDHKGKYRALVQLGFGIFRGWRDHNADGKLDLSGEIWNNVTGLNYHTTRWDKQVMRVGDFSEGCQVVEVASEYDEQMDIIYNSEQSIFSYALF
jgi:hypothetical protein